MKGKGYTTEQKIRILRVAKPSMRRLSGCAIPIEFNQELILKAPNSGTGSERAESFRSSPDLLYTLNHYITPSRLTV